MISLGTSHRMLAFGTADDYTIIDADYVENNETFYQQLEAFNQFYQTEKEVTKRHLASLPVKEKSQETIKVKKIESYGKEWLQNPENAVWELHWDNGFGQENEQYLSQDLYQTPAGQFILHSTSFENETVERGLSTTQIKDFVSDKFSNVENILSQMGISTPSKDKINMEAKPINHPTSIPPYNQLITKIENEYADFKESMKELSKDDMMKTENIYEMMIKNEILHHVREDYVDAETEASLLTSDNILDELYQAYTERDENEFFMPIQAAINNYVTQYQELTEEIQPHKKTPPLFDRTTVEPLGFIQPIPHDKDFHYRQYEFEIDDEMRETWEKFGEEINTSTYRIQYDNVMKKTVIMEASAEDFYIYEDKTHLFNVPDILAYCEELALEDELVNYTQEFEDFLERDKEQENTSDVQYEDIFQTHDEFIPTEELDAEDVRNIKKHKERTLDSVVEL